MEMSFAKWPSALKMRLRLASASGPFARQPEQGPATYCAPRYCQMLANWLEFSLEKVTAIQLASGERRDEGSPLSRALI